MAVLIGIERTRAVIGLPFTFVVAVYSYVVSDIVRWEDGEVRLSRMDACNGEVAEVADAAEAADVVEPRSVTVLIGRIGIVNLPGPLEAAELPGQALVFPEVGTCTVGEAEPVKAVEGAGAGAGAGAGT
jgi:hypothetical protein